MIPPMMEYYKVYRYLGKISFVMKQHQKAKEILIESVEMIEYFLEHSSDPVNSDLNIRSQASAYNMLISLEPDKRDHWIQKADMLWQMFEGNAFEE